MVSSRDAPKTYEDLFNPKWKGKMGMDAASDDWFAGMVKMMGKKKGLEYMRQLAQQDIQLRTGRTLNTQMVASGELSIAISLYNTG